MVPEHSLTLDTFDWNSAETVNIKMDAPVQVMTLRPEQFIGLSVRKATHGCFFKMQLPLRILPTAKKRTSQALGADGSELKEEKCLQFKMVL